jgi:COMPASS component BRE2
MSATPQPIPIAGTASNGEAVSASSVPVVNTENDTSTTDAASTPVALPADTVAPSKQKKTTAPREQREKKESLKMREARGEDSARQATPDKSTKARNSKKASEAPPNKYLEIQRYRINRPKPIDYQPPGAPTLTSGLDLGQKKFYLVSEHVHNKRGYRYVHATADPAFPHMKWNRQTEVQPYEAHFDYEDSSAQIQFSEDAKAVTTDKGWRTSRGNVALREGRWYWELKVLSGIRYPSNPTAKVTDGTHFGGHFRAGISRREASLEHPVGYDAYSYGIRDVHGQKVHMSSPEKFFPPNESMAYGDVIGFELNLPTLALHRKVVEGTYNKAVDVADDPEVLSTESVNPHTLVRDRYPVRYKNELYFEYQDYQPSKELEELFLPPSHSAPPSAAASKPPHPNHPHPALRTLPGSYLKVYKNGKLMGAAFENLLSFLPPASKPAGSGREGLDDGTLGYYPSASVYSGGAVEANFGPNFTCPPPELLGEDDVDMIGESAISNPTSNKRLRSVSERYNEQVAEDVVFDIIDEANCWALDGGVLKDDDDLPGVNIVAAQGTQQFGDSAPDASVVGREDGRTVTQTGEMRTLQVEEE